MNTGQEDVRVAVLNISFSNGYISASCQITGPGFFSKSPAVNLKVDLGGLGNKIDMLKEVLSRDQTEIWAALKDPLAAPASDYVANHFKGCVERVVSDGAGLHSELSKLGLRRILNKINSTLREGDLLSIHTDCAFLPWEILYPLDYDIDATPDWKEQNPPRPELLWGYKYITEYIVLPSPDEDDGWDAPITEHSQGPAYVSLNLNKDIEKEFKNRDFKPIAFHRDFFNKHIGDQKGKLLDDANSIQNFLLAKDNQATIIYLYCHGSSGSPLTGKTTEVLELADQRRITPNTLNPQNTYLRGPIVILNSCTSAAISPLSFTTFHQVFRRKRAMGIIGTTINIPATFAAAFGKELIKSYLQGVPIGKALYSLRRELLQRDKDNSPRDNPLGLFYSLQCPSYITAPK